MKKSKFKAIGLVYFGSDEEEPKFKAISLVHFGFDEKPKLKATVLHRGSLFGFVSKANFRTEFCMSSEIRALALYVSIKNLVFIA